MCEFCEEKGIDFTIIYYKAMVMCHYLYKIVFVQLLMALGELYSSIDWFHAMEI